MDFNKTDIGKTVWAWPTGNNAPRTRQVKATEFILVSVARRYVELRRVDSTYVDWYCKTTGAKKRDVQTGYCHNAGYLFFPSQEALTDHRKHWERIDDIRDFFNTIGWSQALSMEDAKEIHSLIAKHRVR